MNERKGAVQHNAYRSEHRRQGVDASQARARTKTTNPSRRAKDQRRIKVVEISSGDSDGRQDETAANKKSCRRQTSAFQRIVPTRTQRCDTNYGEKRQRRHADGNGRKWFNDVIAGPANDRLFFFGIEP